MKTSIYRSKYALFICILIIILIFLDKLNEIIGKSSVKFDGETEDTIGRTIEYSFRDGFSDCIEYVYIINNHKYKNCETPHYNKNYKMKKFYKVVYQKSNPKISELFLNEEITDTMLIKKAGFKIE